MPAKAGNQKGKNASASKGKPPSASRAKKRSGSGKSSSSSDACYEAFMEVFGKSAGKNNDDNESDNSSASDKDDASGQEGTEATQSEEEEEWTDASDTDEDDDDDDDDEDTEDEDLKDEIKIPLVLMALNGLPGFRKGFSHGMRKGRGVNTDDSSDETPSDDSSSENDNDNDDDDDDANNDNDADDDDNQPEPKKKRKPPSSMSSISASASRKKEKDDGYGTEDERTFMKGVYEEPVRSGSSDQLRSSERSPLRKKRKLEDITTTEPTKEEEKSVVAATKLSPPPTRNRDEIDAEKEYKDLMDVQRDLLARQAKSPGNAVISRALQDCRRSIRKLVRKSRDTNARLYRRLLKSEHSRRDSKKSEIEYFRRKMSNREQLRVLRELRELRTQVQPDKPFRLRLLEACLPAQSKAIAMQRLDMLNQMDPSDGEYFRVKNWMDAFMRLPFGQYKQLGVSISDGVDKCHEFLTAAKSQLDASVYGLEDAKSQVMQFLGQLITNPAAVGTAIALKGPAGTGKTSLAKDGIAKIYGREFAFIALGGASDASYLVGHSYTYEGSMYGRIAQSLMDCQSMSVVFYMDELDKVSETPKGEEIINTLIHLTDSTQNSHFRDRYFGDVTLDLSRCLFVFSYNDESKVSPILRDRMYIIETKKYEVKDKMIIANQYLLPRIRQQVGFAAQDVLIPDDVLQYIISQQSHEEGVRNLKRCLEIIHSKLNLYRLLKPGHSIQLVSSAGGSRGGNDSAIDMSAVSFPYTVTRADVTAFVNKDIFGKSPLNNMMYI